MWPSIHHYLICLEKSKWSRLQWNYERPGTFPSRVGNCTSIVRGSKTRLFWWRRLSFLERLQEESSYTDPEDPSWIQTSYIIKNNNNNNNNNNNINNNGDEMKPLLNEKLTVLVGFVFAKRASRYDHFHHVVDVALVTQPANNFVAITCHVKLFFHLCIPPYMSNTPKPLRFVYGRWQIVTRNVELCVNIPEVERCKQYMKLPWHAGSRSVR